MSSVSTYFHTSQLSNSTVLVSYSNLRDGFVKITGIEESESWELYNSLGNNVLSGRGTSLSLESLNAGIYMLEVGGELHRVIK